MLRIGLPKGVLLRKSCQLMKEIAPDVYADGMLNLNTDNMSIYLLKHRDIPVLIENGHLDVGITSTEWLYENSTVLEVYKYLDWNDTKISLIVSNNKKNGADDIITCATEYIKIASDYFDKMNMPIKEIVKISGSTEATVPNMFDCCVDCVDTGATLRKNNLIEKEVIVSSKVVLVYKNKNVLKDKAFIEFVELLK